MIWTPKQTLIFECLQQGKVPAEIHKEHKITYQAISKVKKAMANGESPGGEGVVILPGSPKDKKKSSQVIVKAPPEDKTNTGVTPTTLAKPELDAATLAKLVPQVAYMQLTPIMIAAKYYLVRELGWSADVKWEDIIDTIIYKYFKGAYRILLQSYTKMDDEKKDSPKPAGGNGKKDNNGSNQLKVDIDSPEFQELCTVVTKQIVELVKAGELGNQVSNQVSN